MRIQLATSNPVCFMSRSLSRTTAVITLALIAMGWMCSTAAACPTCKEGLGNSANLVNGFGWSIIFMMSTPFLVLAGVGGYFYYEICKARAAQRLVEGANQPQTVT
jgi:hypothetical protein